MLVLSRKVDQSVIITTPEGHVIKVSVGKVRRDNSVVLGFDADKGVEVYRQEVYEKIKRERSQGK